jgi:hypothetical protein
MSFWHPTRIQDELARALVSASLIRYTVSDDILPNSILNEHIQTGLIKPVSSIVILTASESNSSTTLTTTTQRTTWRGSMMNMERIVKVEVEVDWGSAGRGDLDLYNVTDGVKIADLATPAAATTRATNYYDITNIMKNIQTDKVIAFQIAGDGTNALTIYKAQILIYMSVGG